VQSRSLASIAYDQHEAILQIEFRGGTLYQYFHVPRQTYQDLLQADSKGTYFNRHVRSIFLHARLYPGESSET
jgi:KTSC domain